jgi:hypothetical protein
MKKALLVLFLILSGFGITIAQQNFFGVQNSQRKGMVNAIMNPAEINNLSKKVEVSLFSFNLGLGNNVLSAQQILDETDNLESIFEDIDQPVNIRTDISVLGPAVGVRLKNWSFGITSQFLGKLDVIDFNPDLGNSIAREVDYADNNQTQIDIPYNQRINLVGWMELGFMAGTKILDTDLHTFSVGANLKLLFPGNYTNLGIDQTMATIIDSPEQTLLTNARGRLNLSYDDRWEGLDEFNGPDDLWRDFVPGGLGVDLGVNYILKKNSKPFLNAGLTVKNLGSMKMGAGQRFRNYEVNIPENQYFNLDNLEGSLDEIEQQLVASGHFNIENSLSDLRVSLPQTIAAYLEFTPVRNFQVSLFGQKRINNERANDKLSAADLIVITPRLVLGKFELYSPWMQHQVFNFTGGFGLQYGGFFIGSHSVITGLLEGESKSADFHMGLSWGFGS